MKITQLTAAEISAAVNKRELTSQTVIEAHLARIAAVNPNVNAVTVPLAEQALALAIKQDQSPTPRPLAGVPFTVKENIDVYGSATSQGIPAFKDAFALANAPTVARLIAAGAIPIARTNLPEFALRLCTDNPLYGPTQNPWNNYLTAGGSGGGDGVALATGMAPLALGNDTGGSLRSPAYCSGVAALKPTLGRVPTVRTLAPKKLGFGMELMQVEGPMARTINDLRIAYQMISGAHPADSRSKNKPLFGSDYEKSIGLVTDIAGVDIPEVTKHTLERVGAQLQQRGYKVMPIQLPQLDAVNELWQDIFCQGLAESIKAMQPIISRGLHLFLVDMMRSSDLSKTNEQHLAKRQQLQAAWQKLLAQYPALIMPTWTQLPWPVDADLDPYTGIPLLHKTTATLTAANVLGFPAVAVPTGVSDGLPTGVQVMANLWREDICLTIAEFIEQDNGKVTPISPR